MAADYQVTDGNCVYTAKKIGIIGDCIVGVAGLVTATNKFLTWFRAGRPAEGAPNLVEDDKDDDTPFNALVLKRSGLYIYVDCCDPDKIEDREYAIGSGQQVALFAMRRLGWNPAEAVKGAHDVDPHTGPKIQTLDVSAIPRQPKG